MTVSLPGVGSSRDDLDAITPGEGCGDRWLGPLPGHPRVRPAGACRRRVSATGRPPSRPDPPAGDVGEPGRRQRGRIDVHGIAQPLLDPGRRSRSGVRRPPGAARRQAGRRRRAPPGRWSRPRRPPTHPTSCAQGEQPGRADPGLVPAGVAKPTSCSQQTLVNQLQRMPSRPPREASERRRCSPVKAFGGCSKRSRILHHHCSSKVYRGPRVDWRRRR